MDRIHYGTHKDDWFAIEVATRDLDGERIKPSVHLMEGLSPDVWFLEPRFARALGEALIRAADDAENT